jgi:SAM-dependent methyltransferase
MTKDVNNYESTARYFDRAIKEIAEFNNPSDIKVLDFGCGSGSLSQCLTELGYDVYGCDVYSTCAKDAEVNLEKIHVIQQNPYRFPFDDNSFNIVISTSVLEHALNTEEIFYEIERVLKPNGYAMHTYPSKWYLPTEPHINVPLINHLWPHCPKWWLSFWHFIGIRAEIQKNKSWKEVTEINYKYCQDSLCYISNNAYRKLSKNVFGNYSAPMIFYINNAHGGAAKLARKLPFKKLIGFLIGEFRMNFIVMQKKS